MPKRFPLLALFLTWLLVVDAPAGNLEVAKVPMPQLAPLQWELLRQQQGGHFQPLRIDVNLAVRSGKVYSVSIRRGTGHDDIDRTIVSMNVDPAIRQVAFRKT